jgi:hypothetical protein
MGRVEGGVRGQDRQGAGSTIAIITITVVVIIIIMTDF